MDKEKSHAFGKDIYLLGADSDGVKYWLEAPSWDCEWYWGFGYVETYTNNANPGRSRDIQSHEHFDGLVGFKKDNGDYIHHLNESPRFSETVLTSSESWELADLMKRFYTLRESAGIFHRGTAHLTSNTRRDSKNLEMEKYINEVELPEIFKAVIDLLSPK
jgi:hypothetical protein